MVCNAANCPVLLIPSLLGKRIAINTDGLEWKRGKWGTNPALLQTMASGCFTIAIDVSFSRDVLADAGIFFTTDVQALADRMQWALDHEQELESYKDKAVDRIKLHYSWDKVTDDYEVLFAEMVEQER